MSRDTRSGKRPNKRPDKRSGAGGFPENRTHAPARPLPYARPVLGAPSAAALKALAAYPDVLREVLPLSAKHRAMLPDGIKRLSAALTSERAGMDANYLRSAGARAAYLHFFLPWNLYRLVRLLPGLDLPLAAGDEVADLGCGPLTLAQALWLARPDLRETELTFWCVDREKKLVTMGMDLLRGLAQATGGDSRAWRIRMVHDPLEKAVVHLPRPLALMASVNVLNELRFDRRDVLADQVAEWVERMAEHVGEQGRLLLVEPGTRLGGKLVSLARAGAVEQGFAPLAPCTHAHECPMLAPRATSWCHFAAETGDAPAWLKSLSRHAGLGKERASLSFSLLAPGDGQQPADAAETAEQDAPTFAGRVVSDPFPVPLDDGAQATGRYACTKHGLVLVFGNPPGDPAGALARLRWTDEEQHDAKTGLRVARWNTPPRPQRAARPARDAKGASDGRADGNAAAAAKPRSAPRRSESEKGRNAGGSQRPAKPDARSGQDGPKPRGPKKRGPKSPFSKPAGPKTGGPKGSGGKAGKGGGRKPGKGKPGGDTSGGNES